MRNNVIESTSVRAATARDIARLTQLAVETYTAAFGDSFEAADLAAHLEANLTAPHIEAFIRDDVVLVAEVAQRMVGFVHFGNVDMDIERAANDDRQLYRLYVQRDFQNSGIGSTLLEAALDHPLLNSAKAIYLEVWEHNLGAQRLYKRYGFEIVDQRRYILPSGEEADLDYIMVRRTERPRHAPHTALSASPHLARAGDTSTVQRVRSLTQRLLILTRQVLRAIHLEGRQLLRRGAGAGGVARHLPQPVQHEAEQQRGLHPAGDLAALAVAE